AKRRCTRFSCLWRGVLCMHDGIALSDLSSCRTRQIRAKLKRRVHWLCCVCFHIHNMPMSVRFFKPPLTSFHQLVGFYRVSYRHRLCGKGDCDCMGVKPGITPGCDLCVLPICTTCQTFWM